MDLLILGGTAMLGRATAAHALAAGHRVTCLARGSAAVADGATLMVGDRDDEFGLASVRDRHWDAVVDVTRHPVHVRRAVRDLDTDHWVFVSSGNAYARFDRREQNESSETQQPSTADTVSSADEYGPGKVACENAVRTAAGTATIVRAGLIGGPGDDTGRVSYYPWRFAHPTGDDVLVPPDLDFPTALIDVDDLAAWLVHCAEQRTDGTFNATGPTVALSDVLEESRALTSSSAMPRPLPDALVVAEGLKPWMGPRSLPLWIDDPTWRWFATLDTSAARVAGLTTRPLRETLQRTLDFQLTLPGPPASGLSDDDERALRRLLENPV